MNRYIALAGLALSLTVNPAAVFAQSAEAQTAAPAFVAPDYAVPTRIEGPGFVLVPLGPALVDIDFAAYMSSIRHLQQTFTRSTGWPREDITATEAMADMESEAARFEKRESFAYAVLTPDGTRERGCVYVAPSAIAGHDAVVRLWVTQAEYDAGFDAELYAWTQDWIAREWPFDQVAYPGRAMAWETWDALSAAAESK
ncbi:MAG: twin-arginine translocation pathway signal protein [Erythrobacter sp.]